MKGIYSKSNINVIVITNDGVCLFQTEDGRYHVGHSLTKEAVQTHEDFQDRANARAEFWWVLDRKLETGKFPWEE